MPMIWSDMDQIKPDLELRINRKVGEERINT
jgi:hypothetical protein